jgi:hypothetical protein
MATLNMDNVDSLGQLAADTAMKAAVHYIKFHGLKVDTDTLVETLRANCKIQLPVALRDAKEALDANMEAVAEQTFIATMVLAGHDAAKEACHI